MFTGISFLLFLQKATAIPAKKAEYFDSSEPVQNRVYKSLKVWSMLADLEESLGTFKVSGLSWPPLSARAFWSCGKGKRQLFLSGAVIEACLIQTGKALALGFCFSFLSWHFSLVVLSIIQSALIAFCPEVSEKYPRKQVLWAVNVSLN